MSDKRNDISLDDSNYAKAKKEITETLIRNNISIREFEQAYSELHEYLLIWNPITAKYEDNRIMQ